MIKRKICKLFGGDLIFEIDMPKEIQDKEEIMYERAKDLITEKLEFKPLTEEQLDEKVKRDLFN